MKLQLILINLIFFEKIMSNQNLLKPVETVDQGANSTRKSLIITENYIPMNSAWIH
jgi:hypothetical protein